MTRMEARHCCQIALKTRRKLGPFSWTPNKPLGTRGLGRCPHETAEAWFDQQTPPPGQGFGGLSLVTSLPREGEAPTSTTGEGKLGPETLIHHIATHLRRRALAAWECSSRQHNYTCAGCMRLGIGGFKFHCVCTYAACTEISPKPGSYP
jgi:hypothetical protein